MSAVMLYLEGGGVASRGRWCCIATAVEFQLEGDGVLYFTGMVIKNKGCA